MGRQLVSLGVFPGALLPEKSLAIFFGSVSEVNSTITFFVRLAHKKLSLIKEVWLCIR